MLDRLDTDYIDLLLLHQQFGDYMGAWKEMELAVANGKVKTIGLSNFESNRLEEVFEKSSIKPAILQVECHPYFQQKQLKERIKPFGTVLESWYPLGHADKKLMSEPIFKTLAEKYRKTVAQIILRWHIQSGNIIFPRSTNPIHIKENISIFDFKLSDDEMAEIDKLDQNKRFYTLSLQEQENQLGQYVPAD